MYICVCVCMRLCMYVCMHICKQACMIMPNHRFDMISRAGLIPPPTAQETSALPTHLSRVLCAGR